MGVEHQITAYVTMLLFVTMIPLVEKWEIIFILFPVIKVPLNVTQMLQIAVVIFLLAIQILPQIRYILSPQIAASEHGGKSFLYRRQNMKLKTFSVKPSF